MTEPTAKPDFRRRRQYLIEKGLQSRIIRQFVWIVVASIVLSHLVSIGFLKFREWFGPSGQDLMYLTNSLDEKVAFTQTLTLLWLPLLISLVTGIALVMIFGMFYSHRIAGPIFNLKRMLTQVGEGRMDVVMRLRRRDELKDVETAFNQMMKKLNEQFDQLRRELEQKPKKKGR